VAVDGEIMGIGLTAPFRSVVQVRVKTLIFSLIIELMVVDEIESVCNENAIARWGWASRDNSVAYSALIRAQWRNKYNDNCEECWYSFMGSINNTRQLYTVSSQRNAHAMVAEFWGGDYQVRTNWRFFQ
jgi:hypothetical protein